MEKSAVIDDTGIYRYFLLREWNSTDPRVAFIMLNPSTADAVQDDPTIRRCIGLARRWGYGSIEVVNLFALRATNPKELKLASDPVGPLNNGCIITALLRSSLRIAAWGVHGNYQKRDKEVLEIARDLGITLDCLGLTRDNFPRHPLYVSNSVWPAPYECEVDNHDTCKTGALKV